MTHNSILARGAVRSMSSQLTLQAKYSVLKVSVKLIYWPGGQSCLPGQIVKHHVS